jgi:single-stranded-DNA-specific exonuclease
VSKAVRIVDRPVAAAISRAALSLGYTPLQARIIAGRLSEADLAKLPALLSLQLSGLTPPDLLPDIDIASECIVSAIKQGLPILLISDFDADGASAHAVLKFAFRDYFGVPEAQIHSYIGHRLRDGYGVTETLTDRIIAEAPRPALIITADQGSTDHARIARLRDHGFIVVVTDHHGVPASGPPPAAVACVNPVREDSAFPDPYIAGVHVAWLLCCAVRQRLIQAGDLPASAPKLGGLLDLVALGTMADCVDLARSTNNKAIIARGLEIMNSPVRRPAWQALYVATHCKGPITAATLAFHFAPVINARGRLDSALGSVDLLMSGNAPAAEELAQHFVEHNTERKAVQSNMLHRSTAQAAQQVRDGAAAITIFDPEGHAGVHGICAARLAESFGRPVAYFSPKNDAEHITASLRTVHGFHVRNALAEIADRYPDDFIAWGGHAGAGGVTLKQDGLQRFAAAWASMAARALDGHCLGPEVVTDGELAVPLSFALVEELAALEPFGRQWEHPVFRSRGRIEQVRPVGDGRHLKLVVKMDAMDYDAIWFGAVENGICPVGVGQTVLMAYELDVNTFRDTTTLQLRIRHAALVGEGI